MTSSEVENRNIAISMRKSVENLVISSQDAIGQSISQALTFSGVIAHHSNQILHENSVQMDSIGYQVRFTNYGEVAKVLLLRNISRSPSPSLRICNADAAGDAIQHDKLSDVYTPAPDSISVSSAELAASKLDNKGISNPSCKSSEGVAVGGRAKKKSWYNALYPTYKSKSDDFKRLFRDLPDDERLIVDYSCALQKDILAHGRLYASQHYLCFYANIFGWETTLQLRWEEVTAITKEKTALVIPNAILVCTDSEKNFLTSFSGRDKAYLMLFRIWQNALMDQPLTTNEIWQWVHSCYGEELGFNSDDEEYPRDPADEPQLTEEAGEAGGGDQREELRPPRPPRQRDSSPPLVSNGDGCEEEGGLPTDMSDSSDSEPDDQNTGCVESCSESHEGRLLLRRTFAFNVDQLFTMIFTNSSFSLELLTARSITDYVQSQWQTKGGLKCRQINYKLGLTAGPIGPKEVHVTETQIMNKCSKPGALYSIDSTSDNAGIPYADYFSVVVHYCLRRVGDALTELQLYGHVKYKKTIWPMIKSFLEKNAMNGVEEFSRLLEARLGAEAGAPAPAGTVRKTRRHRRLTMASSQEAGAGVGAGAGAGASSGGGRSGGAARWAALLLLLVALNALLYYRLYLAARPAHPRELEAQLAAHADRAAHAWARALRRHAARDQRLLHDWRQALHTATEMLAQTEQAIQKLLEAIQPSVERARDDAPHTDL